MFPMFTDRAILRFHVEAVWGVKLPELEENECTLLPASARPEWRLCAANVEEGRVLIWREACESTERARLLRRLDQVWSQPEHLPLPAETSREYAFRLSATARLAVAESRRLARALGEEDFALLESFWPGEAEKLLYPEPRPLRGVVVGGRLLCLAHSSRRTSDACELGIDTLREARRKGYALAATVAWSGAILDEGLVPIYSALAENMPSRRLAWAAGYRPFARAVTLV